MAEIQSALDSEALVHTSRGVIPVADLRAGDIAFRLDELANDIQRATVAGVVAEGERDLLAITVATQKILLTADTSVLTLVDRRRPGRLRRRFHREWTPASELKRGDLVAVALKTPDLGVPHAMTIPVPRGVQLRRSNAVHLPKVSNVDLMWLLGLFIGDGWIDSHRGSKQVDFAIPSSDHPLRAELSDTASRLFGLPVRAKSEWTVAINSFRVADYLEANGIRGNARTKRIPAWVSTVPEEQRLAFIGGYADADGHVAASRKNKGMQITSANRELLEDTRRLVAMCGLRGGSIYRFERADGRLNDVGFRLPILGDFDRVACRSPQRTSRLGKRKYKRNFTSTTATCFRTHTSVWIGFALVKAVAHAGKRSTFAVRTEGSNFVAEGLIVRA